MKSVVGREVQRNRAKACKEIKTVWTVCTECESGWVANAESKGKE